RSRGLWGRGRSSDVRLPVWPGVARVPPCPARVPAGCGAADGCCEGLVRCAVGVAGARRAAASAEGVGLMGPGTRILVWALVLAVMALLAVVARAVNA